MKTNFISLFVIAIVASSCSTSQMASKQVDDDVYFSTKDLRKSSAATGQTSEQSDYTPNNQTQTNTSTTTTSSDDYYDQSYANRVTNIYPYGYGLYRPCYSSAFGYPSYYGSGLSFSFGYNYYMGNGMYLGIGNSWGYNPYGSFYGGYYDPYMSYNNAFWNGYYSGLNSNYYGYGNYYYSGEYGNRYYGARKTLAANSNVVSRPSGRAMRNPNSNPIEIKTIDSKQSGKAERQVNSRGGKPPVKTEEKKTEKEKFDLGKLFSEPNNDGGRRNTNVQSTPSRQSNPQPSRSVSAPRRR